LRKYKVSASGAGLSIGRIGHFGSSALFPFRSFGRRLSRRIISFLFISCLLFPGRAHESTYCRIFQIIQGQNVANNRASTPAPTPPAAGFDKPAALCRFGRAL
jgi:hypothetical protein